MANTAKDRLRQKAQTYYAESTPVQNTEVSTSGSNAKDRLRDKAQAVYGDGRSIDYSRTTVTTPSVSSDSRLYDLAKDVGTESALDERNYIRGLDNSFTYTPENVSDNLDRINNLLSKENWTDRDIENAKSAHDALTGASAWQNLLYGITKNDKYETGAYQKSITDADASGDWTSVDELGKLAGELNTRLHPTAVAIGGGIIKGTGAESVAKAITSTVKDEDAKETLSDQYASVDKSVAQAAKERPLAYGAANVAGSLALLSGVSGLTKAAFKLGAAPVSAVVKTIAQNALAFAGMDAVQNVGDYTTGAMTGEQFGRSFGASLAGGAAGTLASGLVSSGIAKVLSKTGLQTPFMEYIRGVASGTSFAGGNLAAMYSISGEKPTKQQMATDLATAFLFSAITSGVSTYETTQANKAVLMNQVTQMQNDYMRMANGNLTAEERIAAADNMLAYSQNCRTAISQTYYAGQQKYINEVLKSLDALDEIVTGVKNTAQSTVYTGNALGEGVTDINTGNAGGAITPVAPVSGSVPSEPIPADEITGAATAEVADLTSQLETALSGQPLTEEAPIATNEGLASPAAVTVTETPVTTPVQPAASQAPAQTVYDESQIKQLASALGENGGKAFAREYGKVSGSVDPSDFFGDFARVYNIGKKYAEEHPNRTDLNQQELGSLVPDVQLMDSAQIYSAFYSGVNDAGTNVVSETTQDDAPDMASLDIVKGKNGDYLIWDGEEQVGTISYDPETKTWYNDMIGKTYNDIDLLEQDIAPLTLPETFPLQNSDVENTIETGTDQDISAKIASYPRKTKTLLKKWAANERIMVDLNDTAEAAPFVQFFDKWYQAGREGKHIPYYEVDSNDNKFPPFLQDVFYNAGKTDAAAEAAKNAETKEVEGNGEAEGRTADNGTVSKPSVPGNGDGGILEEVSAEDVQQHGGQGRVVSGADEGGGAPSRSANRHDAERNGGGRSLGSGEGADLRPGTGEVTKEQTALTDAVDTRADQTVTEAPKGRNFTIGDSLNLPNGEKARFKSNIEAIHTLRQIMAEGRYATEDEQVILSKYVGWGGLANAFDSSKTEWAKEYNELKELLSDEEYKGAKGSTLNAHYTDIGVIKAMYSGLSTLGYQGGRMLEPSGGVGHFIGAMPAELSAQVKSWTLVELDPITGNIAKYLYPNSDVRVQGFEKSKLPDNLFDVAISNVPFGNYGIIDKSYPKQVTGAIHNYFFAKALDKVRPGGLVMFITSRYTMDSANNDVRYYIQRRADLLGAIRLPDTAFKSNAGTEVVTDILILKKRADNTPYAGEEFLSAPYQNISNGGTYVNEYFKAHPKMVLGTAIMQGTMYARDSLTYKALPGNLNKQIEEAFGKITGRMEYPKQSTAEADAKAVAHETATGIKKGAFVHKDGKLFREDNGELVEQKIDAKKAERITAMLGVRDQARQLLNMQLENYQEDAVKKFRKSLNTAYDEFVTKYGFINSPANKSVIGQDPDYPFISALENYDKDTKTATKADIFTKNTVTPAKTITHVDSAAEGLIVSMNETGGVDTGLISRLTGQTKDEITRQLIDSRLTFKDRTGKLVTAEQYLSGNVKAKLRDSEALVPMDKDYQNNVDELKKIIPADIPYQDIYVQPGTTWIPDVVYSDFAAYMLGTSNYEWRTNAEVTYVRSTGQYNVELKNNGLKYSVENTETWGTRDRSFVKLLEALMNNRSVTVRKKIDENTTVVDKQATIAAQEMMEKIKQEFQSWIWTSETRRSELASLYNDMYNNTVTPKYDGSNLTVKGANPAKPLREHQRNAVQRVISSGGNTLLAHKVGAGKTAEMAAAAMKMRQLGIVKKPMFVVPKSLVGQWGKEFLDFFPTAKVLVLGDKDFTSKNRKTFANRIATGDYDAVILSQEQFKAIPMSPDNLENFYQEQIDALELAITDTRRAKGKGDISIKQMEKAKKSFEAKLNKLGDMRKDEDNIDFESLGIDSLFVDEAHSYKNLFYTTNMQNVSGLGNRDGSQKAFDLYMKVRYLQQLNSGRGIVFATATPVMNSMSEMYIMQKYLQGDLLDQRDISSFDAWANQFGEVVTVNEPVWTGKGYRKKQSFSRFKNLGELQQMFTSFSDVLTDIPGLKIPSMKEGKRIIVESEPSDFQIDYIDKLAERADAVRTGRVDPKKDNMLKITSDGRKLSYSQRLIDPSMPYENNGKIYRCAEEVAQIYKETGNTKGTQLIFCDMAIPKGGQTETTEDEIDITEESDNVSIYDDIKRQLILAGIPSDEIAFIHSADTKEKKEKLFQNMNDGKVRVLLGSTGKMGVGMNAQKRMVALHHLDAPWRPGDIEQREGRALRQGNMNEEVGIYVYVTKKTFDSRMWDNLQRKASFIHQIMSGTSDAREAEGDGDFALSAAEIKSIASGDPLIMEQFEVAADITKLEALKREHTKSVLGAKSKLEFVRRDIISAEGYIPKLEKDISDRADIAGDKFNITINGKSITERKTAGQEIINSAKDFAKETPGDMVMQQIGSAAGFELSITNKGEGVLKGQGFYRFTLNMDSPVGTIQSMENVLRSLDTRLTDAREKLESNRAGVAKLEKIINAPFDRQDELTRLISRNNEIMSILNPKEDVVGEDDIDEMLDAEDTERLAASTPEEKWSASRVGDKNKAPMPLSDIISKIRHDFGIPVTKGGIRGKGTLGEYRPNANTIRTKIANDLPTVAHELGHYLDHKFDLAMKMDAATKKELTDNLDDGMKKLYPKKKWATEGVAEFLRRYLQNRETAAIDYPLFTAYFRNETSGLISQIDELADEINAYYSLDADTASSAIKMSGERGKDFRTFKEKAGETFDRIYQAWIDSNHGIKRFDEATGASTYKLASNSAYSDAIAYSLLTGALTDIHGQRVADGLIATLKDIKTKSDKEYRDFGEYLIVKHGPERLREGMRIFADDRKNSTIWMNNRQAELERQYPEFKGTSEKLYNFQRQFLKTWGVDTGLVSPESFNAWGERWEFYVPLNRDVSEKGRIGAKRGFANQNSTIKKAIGSGLDIVHPVDNIINNIVKMVNAGTRNNVMRVITIWAKTTDGSGLFLEHRPMPVKKKTFDATKLKDDLKQATIDAGLKQSDEDAVFDIINNIDDILVQYGRGKAYGDIVTVLNGGTPEYWKINDPLLLSSITNLSPARLPAILEAYGRVSRFITGNITGNNVLWSIFSNFPRDLITYFTFSEYRNPLKMLGGIGSAYINKVKGNKSDPLYKEFVSMGGGRTSAYTADKDLTKNIRRKMYGDKKQWINPLEWVEFAADTVELGPRFSYYKILRGKGFSPEEAFYGSADITVNFRRGGPIGRELNKVIPFFNAGVQGLDKFARWISAEDAPKAQRAKTVRGRVLTFIAVSAALAALTWIINSGDEEAKKNYAQLSNYTKNTYWCIPLGDGKYFTVPKPRDLAVMTSFFETCLEYYANGNDKAFEEFYAYFADQCLPNVINDVAKGDLAGAIGSLGLIGIGAYMMANRDFLGKPIVSSGLSNLEPKDQYTDRTSKIAYWVGQAFNLSPVMVDYFFQQTLGGWWKAQKALFPVGSENVDFTLGIQNQYIRDNQFSTDLVNRLYDAYNKSLKEKNSNPDDMGAAVSYKWYNTMTTFYSRYYKLAKGESETTGTRATRQTVLNMISEFEKNLDNGYKTSVQKYVEDFCKKTGETAYMPSVVQSTLTYTLKSGTAEQTESIDLNASQYVQYQTEYLTTYWDYIESSLDLNTDKTTPKIAAILKEAKSQAADDAKAKALKRLGITTEDYSEYQAASAAGVSPAESVLFNAAYNTLISDKDADGKTIPNSKQDKVIDALDSMKLTDEERSFLFGTVYSSDKNNPYN